MNIEFTYLLGPLTGGIIGYFTNWLAIKMMFCPHQPKYLFGKKIPFTPGLIPKERGRIAEAVGSSISENLMNREVLEKNLLSEDMLTKIGTEYDTFIARQKVNGETLRAFLSHFISKQDLKKIQSDAGGELASQIHSRLADSNLGNMLAHAAVEHAINKMENSLLGFAFNAEQFLILLQEPAEHLLSKHINQIISNNSEEIISNLIGQESNKLLDTPVCELLKSHDEQLTQLRHILLDGYRQVITVHLPKILFTIDISRIICNRINELDIEEGEKIIFSVMEKELRAIVWLGALLGGIIGVVNSLF
ncbi:MAG: membrane protein [bacterium F082]|nr:MAG: membrane protein [bacterium F082]KWW28498.1 MAG: membrane protein [bacterium P201]